MSEPQISKILDRLVPLIAKKEDHVFFRFTLAEVARTIPAATFGALVHKLLHFDPSTAEQSLEATHV